jgi:hypothetical protein
VAQENVIAATRHECRRGDDHWAWRVLVALAAGSAWPQVGEEPVDADLTAALTLVPSARTRDGPN